MYTEDEHTLQALCELLALDLDDLKDGQVRALNELAAVRTALAGLKTAQPGAKQRPPPKLPPPTPKLPAEVIGQIPDVGACRRKSIPERIQYLAAYYLRSRNRATARRQYPEVATIVGRIALGSDIAAISNATGIDKATIEPLVRKLDGCGYLDRQSYGLTELERDEFLMTWEINTLMQLLGGAIRHAGKDLFDGEDAGYLLRGEQ